MTVVSINIGPFLVTDRRFPVLFMRKQSRFTCQIHRIRPSLVEVRDLPNCRSDKDQIAGWLSEPIRMGYVLSFGSELSEYFLLFHGSHLREVSDIFCPFISKYLDALAQMYSRQFC